MPLSDLGEGCGRKGVLGVVGGFVKEESRGEMLSAEGASSKL